MTRPTPDLLLRVTAPKTAYHDGFVAGAVVRREGPHWRWVTTAPIIRWFQRQSVANIGKFLNGAAKRAGWTYTWSKIDA